MPGTKQQNLILSLQIPSFYPHDSDRLQLIETHISWIILCGPYAYKIKKALNLGFLDFTTLEKRKFYCQEEMRLNGRLAPELYLAVIPITGTPDRPQLEGHGEVIEYAVKMRRFPQQALLSRMVAENRLEYSHIDQVIAQVAQFHQNIPVADTGARYGDPEHVCAPVHENNSQIRERTHDPRHIHWLDSMNEWAQLEYQICHDQFLERKARGFIRECHGDMHLGNMAIVDGRLVIFDGIEFNPGLYWIDVMSEVAFLCMDLEDHNMRDLAFRFLNGYLDSTGDYAGLGVFRYYLAYRAMVRAKVESIRLKQKVDSNSRSSEAREFERYLQLAMRYTQPQRPILLITHGLSGSGKSTHSAPLAEQMGLIRIRSDRERQRLFGKSNKDRETATIDQGVYNTDATRQTYAKLVDLTTSVLESGHCAIIDAAFLERPQRELFKQLADRLGLPIRILWFRADADVLRQRIARRQQNGSDISEANLNVLEHQLKVYAGPDEDEQKYTVTIDTESVPGTEKIHALLDQSLARTSHHLQT